MRTISISASHTRFSPKSPKITENHPKNAFFSPEWTRKGQGGPNWVRLGHIGPEWAKKGQNRPKIGQNRPKMGQKWPARENKASGAIMYGIYEAFRRNFAGFAEFFGGKHVSGSKIGYYPVLAKITQNRGKSPGKGVFLPHFAFTGGFPALTTFANVLQITASAGNAFFLAILAEIGRIWPDFR